MNYSLLKTYSRRRLEFACCAHFLVLAVLQVGCLDLSIWDSNPECSGKMDGLIGINNYPFFYESPYSIEIYPKPSLPEGSGLLIEFAAFSTNATFRMYFSFSSSEVTSYVESLKQLELDFAQLSPWGETDDTFGYELNEIDGNLEQYANSASRTTVNLIYNFGARHKIGKNHFRVAYPVALDPFLAKGQTQFEYFGNDFKENNEEKFSVQFRSGNISGVVECN